MKDKDKSNLFHVRFRFCRSAAPPGGGLANCRNIIFSFSSNAPSRGERPLLANSKHIFWSTMDSMDKLELNFLLLSCHFSLSKYSKQRSNHSQMDLESYIKAEVDQKPEPWMSIILRGVKAAGGARNTEVESRPPMSMDKLSTTFSWHWKNTYECFYISFSLRQIPKQRPYFSLMDLRFKNRTEVSQRSRPSTIICMSEVKTDRGSGVILVSPRSVKSLEIFPVFENTNLETLKKFLTTLSFIRN